MTTVASASRNTFAGDPSLWTLLASNLITIAVALFQGWDAGVLMWVYWSQSVIIGMFNAVRIWNLRNYSTDDFYVNNKPVQPSPGLPRSTAIFFAFHYGFFHFVYFIFLIGMARIPLQDVKLAALCAAAFFVNHLFSFRYNLEADASSRPNIGTVMFFPYARILPMHLAIIFGGGFFGGKGRGMLLIFLGLKTVADLIMHAVEHAKGRKSPAFSMSLEGPGFSRGTKKGPGDG